MSTDDVLDAIGQAMTTGKYPIKRRLFPAELPMCGHGRLVEIPLTQIKDARFSLLNDPRTDEK